MGHIKDLQPILVSDERVTELHCDSGGLIQERSANFCGDLGVQGIVKAHDFEPSIAEDISVQTGNGNPTCACQFSLGIEGHGAMEEIVCRISIEQRAYAGEILLLRQAISDNDQALILIGSI